LKWFRRGVRRRKYEERQKGGKGIKRGKKQRVQEKGSPRREGDAAERRQEKGPSKENTLETKSVGRGGKGFRRQ